jgi:hypothetical protein
MFHVALPAVQTPMLGKQESFDWYAPSSCVTEVPLQSRFADCSRHEGAYLNMKPSQIAQGHAAGDDDE